MHQDEFQVSGQVDHYGIPEHYLSYAEAGTLKSAPE